MKRIVFIITLLFSVISAHSQDRITRTDGSNIYCRIIRVDSNMITYKTPQVKDEQAISRSLVQSYYQSSSASRSPALAEKKSPGAAEVFLLRFTFGGSRPLAEFARQDVSDEKAGLAMGGLAGEIGAIIKVHRFVGIGFEYKLQANNFNVDAIVDGLRAQIPQTTFRGEADPWKMRGLFAGLHLCVPLTQPDGLWITADVGGGIPRFVFPNITIVGVQKGVSLTVKQSASPVSSPALTAGVGLRYKISKVVAFTLNADFYRAHPSFRVVTSNSSGFSDTVTYAQTIRTLNVCIGLAFCFAGK